MEKNNYCTLYIVRHGETEWNKNGTVMGQMDSPLTPEGVEQVKATAEALKHVHFDAIFSSDSPRAQRTAEIIRLDRKLAVQTSKLLRERKYGHFEGGSAAKYHTAIQHLLEEKERLAEKEKWKFRLSEDIESDEELAERFLVQLREIAAAYPGKTVLVTTHGGCVRTFLMRTIPADYEKWSKSSFPNAGYVKALSDSVDFFVEEVAA
jgi:broad specificity phosphatase PhoE